MVRTMGGTSKRLTVRRPGTCAACGRSVAVGEQAIWESATRRLTCVGCASVPPPTVDGAQPGGSALREYERRHKKREQHARERLGVLGLILARVIEQPQSTRAWKQGGQGEVRTGERLDVHRRGHGVR